MQRTLPATLSTNRPESEADVTPNGSEESADVSESPPRTFCGWPVTEDIKIPHHWPLARGEVNYAGEPWPCLATDRYKAQDALEYIEVDYEPLWRGETWRMRSKMDSRWRTRSSAPTSATPGRSRPGTSTRPSRRPTWSSRDATSSSASSPAPSSHRAVVATSEPATGGFVMYTSTQVPHFVKDILSAICGLPDTRLRVVAPDVGGGFGSKLNVYAEEALALALARRLGVPIKWVEDRTENHLATIHGRGQVQHIELAATNEGKILGMKVRLLADMGAYLQLLTPGIAVLGAFTYPGLYTFDAYSFECVGVFTNLTPTDAYRGAGRSEAAYAHERIMDDLARELDMDPAELRLRT